MVQVYASLDVSDKATHVCVVDTAGAVVWRGACATDPEAVARTLKQQALHWPRGVRVAVDVDPYSFL